jgi:hypothetical protein
MEERKAQLIISNIADKIFHKVNLGFNPGVLDVLSNLDSTEPDIELLKVQIGNDILGRLFGIANSAYFGQLRRGNVETFYEVVTRLGMDFTKLIILFMSMAGISKDEKTKIIFARSFATSIIASKLLANECSLTYEDAKKVEMGGLLLEIGKIIISVYHSVYPEEYKQAGIDDDFATRYHSVLGIKFIENFKFSETLKEIISAKCLTIGQKLITLPGIVMVAHSIVDYSFQNFHNKLVIASPMPDRNGNVISTTAWVIEGMFRAVGLSGYIEIINKN